LVLHIVNSDLTYLYVVNIKDDNCHYDDDDVADDDDDDDDDDL